MPDPQETVHITQAPYKQAAPMFMEARAYSDTWALWENQYSICALNGLTGTYQWPTGITKVSPPPAGRYAPNKIIGDCWQSVTGIAASKDTPKWLVATGAPNMCDFQGLQVWKFESGTWRWKGLINGRISRLVIPRIVGDMAYAAEPGSSTRELVEEQNYEAKAVAVPAGRGGPWKVFDLATMSLKTYTVDPPPAGEIQPDINGSTYKLTIEDAQNWTAHRTGGVVIPPEPPDPNELPLFCPNRMISRGQVSAIVYQAFQFLKNANPTLNIIVPEDPHAQNFRDIPPEHMLAPSVDALAHANIVAGMPPGTTSCE